MWNLDFEFSGTYKLLVHTPAPWAQSKKAKYQVRHDGQTTVKQVDQTAVNGWTEVGEFDFAAGGNQWVRLEDLTGEANSTHTKIVMDAIQLARVTNGYSGGDGPQPDEDEVPMDKEPTGPSMDDDPADEVHVRTNWSCSAGRSGSNGSSGWPFLLVLLAIVLFRRRFQ